MKRSIEQIFEDGLWPHIGGICLPGPEESQRHLAIAIVLSDLPENDYQKLVQAVDAFHWHVPHYDQLGEICPFWPNYEQGELPQVARILYLSPRLESGALSIAVAVVAHELAHIVLNHNLIVGEEYDAQEDATWSLVIKWGFGKAVKRRNAMRKRQRTRERNLIETLSRKRSKGQINDGSLIMSDG